MLLCRKHLTATRRSSGMAASDRGWFRAAWLSFGLCSRGPARRELETGGRRRGVVGRSRKCDTRFRDRRFRQSGGKHSWTTTRSRRHPAWPAERGTRRGDEVLCERPVSGYASGSRIHDNRTDSQRRGRRISRRRRRTPRNGCGCLVPNSPRFNRPWTDSAPHPVVSVGPVGGSDCAAATLRSQIPTFRADYTDELSCFEPES